MPSIPQTSVIFFFLLAGFVIYITAKGELKSYLGVLFGSAAPASGS
jgi:hypothetical protein